MREYPDAAKHMTRDAMNEVEREWEIEGILESGNIEEAARTLEVALLLMREKPKMVAEYFQYELRNLSSRATRQDLALGAAVKALRAVCKRNNALEGADDGIPFL